jgi:hypothetical protein
MIARRRVAITVITRVGAMAFATFATRNASALGAATGRAAPAKHWTGNNARREQE